MQRRGEWTRQAEETGSAKAGRHLGKELEVWRPSQGGPGMARLCPGHIWSGFGGAEQRDRVKSQLSQEAVQ